MAMTSATRQSLRFVRFNFVGSLGAAVQLSLLALLTKGFGMPGVPATAAAVEMTVLHNFLWHQCFTWRDRKGISPAPVRLWRFYTSNGLVSLAGNATLTYWLTERFGVPVLPADLGAILVCALVNYLVADRWVFADGARPAG